MVAYAGHDWKVGDSITEPLLQALDDAAAAALPRGEASTTYPALNGSGVLAIGGVALTPAALGATAGGGASASQAADGNYYLSSASGSSVGTDGNYYLAA